MNIYTKRTKPIKRFNDFTKKYYNDFEDKHIGKRSAAGIWCWDCLIPMYDEDRKQEVAGISVPTPFEFCPSCGNKVETDKGYNPAMRELGFDKSEPTILTGIQGANRFTWCTDAVVGLGTTKKQIIEELQKNHKFVITEYGDTLSLDDFFKIFKQVIEERFVTGEFS